jgi:hypothetical protein
MKLSNPKKSGYTTEVGSIDEAKRIASERWFDCAADEIVTRESPDGGTIYLYASDDDADADQDGAYAVQVELNAVEA